MFDNEHTKTPQTPTLDLPSCCITTPRPLYDRLLIEHYPMPLPPEMLKNHLLAALPEAEGQRWMALLEPVALPLAMVLYDSGTPQRYVYFPVDAIVSLLYVLEDGASAEIAVVGNEGLVGVSLFMGGGSTPSRAVVQSAGRGFRLSAHAVQEEFNRAGPVLHLLLRYTQALITQMAQNFGNSTEY